MATKFDGDVSVAGTLYTRGSTPISPPLPRTSLQQNNNTTYPVNLVDLRVWDALQTNLPGTPANDDLGLIGGTFGTNSPTVQSGDLKAAGATSRYARFMLRLPAEYVAGETVTLRCHAGMKTTVADNTATLDVEAYESDREEGISADLCATAAQSINSLTLADKDYTITATSLAPGEMLDIRLTMAINDAATGTSVIGIIGAIELVCDVQG